MMTALVRAALLLVVLGCSEFRDARRAGQAAGELVAAHFELAADTIWGKPTLEVQPGTAHYFPQLEAEGPQLHFFSEKLAVTAIVGQTRLGDERIRWLLASYGGAPPARRFRDLVVYAPPGELVVTVRDRRGEPVPKVWVSLEHPDGGVQRSTTDRDGAADFRVEAGRYRVRRDNVFLWWDGAWQSVDVPEHGIVHAVLDRDGLHLQ